MPAPSGEVASPRGWGEAPRQDHAHASSQGHAETRRLAGTPLGHGVIQVLHRKTPETLTNTHIVFAFNMKILTGTSNRRSLRYYYLRQS